MKLYSVLLLYPDYATENYGQDTYYVYVCAETPLEASRIAQEEAWKATGGSVQDQEDFAVLGVWEGHNPIVYSEE